MIDEIMRHNREFVAGRAYEAHRTSKYPDRRLAILTCMDTRLEGMLPAALGLRPGDVKMVRVAGGVITDPLDSAMRSLLVAVYELGVEEIMVIAHTGCGVQGMTAAHMLPLMEERGVPRGNIDMMRRCGVDLDRWLRGFRSTEEAVADCVRLIRRHPLMCPGVRVAGYVLDTGTGRLTPVETN